MNDPETCILCDGPGTVVRRGLSDRLFGASGTWGHRRCDRCLLWWLVPQPKEEEIPGWYESYYTHEGSSGDPWGAAPRLKEALARRALGYPTPRPLRTLGIALRAPAVADLAAATAGWIRGPARGRLLDLGCGNGDLLVRARSLGWEAEGAEIDHDAAERGRRVHGLVIHELAASHLTEALGSYEVVTLIHVLEHLSDPVNALRSVARLLPPSGECIVATPNPVGLGSRLFGPEWVHLDPPRHLYLFSPRAARRCAEKAGFEVLSLRTSSRLARFTWTASREIQERGKVQWEASPSAGRRIAALLFQLYESFLPGDRCHGEEIVMRLRRAG